MASTLVVENGTNVANANSYVTLTEFRAYALLRGVTISADDAIADAIMYKAMDYIENRLRQAQGMRAYVSQLLEFPRAEVYSSSTTAGLIASTTYGIMINCMKIAIGSIPKQLKLLQMQVGLAINSGVDFAHYSQEQKFVISEKVGPLEQKYSESFGSVGGISIASIDSLFDILLYPCGGGGFLTNVRV